MENQTGDKKPSVENFYRCGNCKKFPQCKANMKAQANDSICSEFEPANAIMKKIGDNYIFLQGIEKNKKIKIWVDIGDFEDTAFVDIVRKDDLMKTQARKQIIKSIIDKIGGNHNIAKGLDFLLINIDKNKQIENENKEEEKSRREKLIKLATERCNFFHDEHGEAFVSIKLENDSIRVSPLRGREFKNFLSYMLYQQEGYAPNQEILNSALNTLEAISIFEGEKIKLHIRTAGDEDAIYYDLANQNWQIIKITKDGWKITPHKVILFRRYRHMNGQVVPKGNGNFKLFLKYANLKNKEDGILLLASIASFIIPDIPHPIVVLYGEPGSTKTTLSRLIKKIVDPSSLELNSFSDEKRELVQIFAHNYLLVFDNVSRLLQWQSDLLCRAVTGEGFSKRELYTNDEDVIYSFKRCILLNDVNIPLYKPDILDRAILIELKPISKEERKTEREIFQEFEKDLLLIFTGLVEVVSKAMVIVNDVRKELSYLPRMADFCIWGEATARAMGYPKFEFYKRYLKHIRKKEILAIEENVVGELLLQFIKDKNEWKGTASELYNELEEVADQLRVSKKLFPKTPNVLSRRINEIVGNLRRMGIKIEKVREGEKGERKIIISKKSEEKNQNIVNIVRPSEIREKSADDIKSADDLIVGEKETVSKIISVTDDFDSSDDIFHISHILLEQIPHEPYFITIDELMEKLGFKKDEPNYDQHKEYVVEKLKDLAKEDKIKILDEDFSKFSKPRRRDDEKSQMPKITKDKRVAGFETIFQSDYEYGVKLVKQENPTRGEFIKEMKKHAKEDFRILRDDEAESLYEILKGNGRKK